MNYRELLGAIMRYRRDVQQVKTPELSTASLDDYLALPIKFRDDLRCAAYEAGVAEMTYAEAVKTYPLIASFCEDCPKREEAAGEQT